MNALRSGNKRHIVMFATPSAVRRACTLPQPRGSLTERLFEYLHKPRAYADFSPPDDVEDATLALYALYELHYRGFDGVHDKLEWDTTLLSVRAALERGFEEELRHSVGTGGDAPMAVTAALQQLASDDGPSLSQWMLDHGTMWEMREFAMHRSAYQLKEADPHSWAVPRLDGRAKAALVEIQHGEYGDGCPSAMHAELFADTMRALDLDANYGAYVDALPASTLATVNLVSLFGLHRRLRGALIGHLALFEMCSVTPMARYRDTLRRLGCAVTEFYDAHVVADRRHASIALTDMAGALADDEPDLAADIVFGARALRHVENEFAAQLLAAWSTGRSSLRCA